MDSFEIKYQVLESIGTGYFSEVFKVRSYAHEQALFAAKRIPLAMLEGADGGSSQFQRELDILKLVNHPNIVSLLDSALSHQHIFLIMELADGGELFDRIVERGAYHEADAAAIVRQLLDACAYLHTLHIVHRDLKPENILFKTKDPDSPVMITDFGLSALMTKNRDMLQTACGTPGYAAPEILQQVPYNEKVDSWSIGVISYILLCGYPPFYSDDDSVLFQQILNGDYQFHDQYWHNISAAAKLFVSKLLHREYSHRLSCSAALHETWIVDCCDHPDDVTGVGAGAQSSADITTLVIENLKDSLNGRRWQRAFDAISVVQKFKSLGIRE